MSFFGTVKKNARLALRGNWGSAIGIFVMTGGIVALLAVLEQIAVYFFVMEPMSSNPTMEAPADYAQFLQDIFTYNWTEILILGISVLLAMLLLSPLWLGVSRYFYCLAQEERPRFSDLFYFFDKIKRYRRAVWYTVQINLRAFFWGVLFQALPFGMMAISIRFLRLEAIDRQTRAAASVGIVLAFGLIVLAAVLHAVLMCKYTLTSYLLCENDEMTVRQAIRASIRCTKRCRGMLFLFSLSYIGWYLLSPFTFFLLLLYAAPYRAAGGMLLGRYLVERGRIPEDGVRKAWTES